MKTIPTFTGAGFQPFVMNHEDVRIDDIAHGLAFRYVFGGHTQPMTLAEHSLLVAKIIEVLWPDKNLELAGLMSNAANAYLPEIPQALREFVTVNPPGMSTTTWGELEIQTHQMIVKALGFKNSKAREISTANHIALALEVLNIPEMKFAAEFDVLVIPSAVAHLKIEYLEPSIAMLDFLDLFNRLTAAQEDEGTETLRSGISSASSSATD